jgi:hypothetical protein
MMKTNPQFFQSGVGLTRWARRLNRRPEARLILLAAVAVLTLGGGADRPEPGPDVLERVGAKVRVQAPLSGTNYWQLRELSGSSRNAGQPDADCD